MHRRLERTLVLITQYKNMRIFSGRMYLWWRLCALY